MRGCEGGGGVDLEMGGGVGGNPFQINFGTPKDTQKTFQLSMSQNYLTIVFRNWHKIKHYFFDLKLKIF